MSKVEITELGFSTLTILMRYQAVFTSEAAVLDEMERLVDMAVDTLTEHPLQYPVCYELEMLGVMDYRQLTFDKFKVLYRFDEMMDTSYIMAFMRHRQSAQELLVHHSLL